MKKGQRAIGFGFDPNESPYHFALVIPEHGLGPVWVEERFTWEGTNGGAAARPPVKKAELDLGRWRQIAEAVRVELNQRLRAWRMPAADWKMGDNLLAPPLGKELAVLFWALEDPAKPEELPSALANWRGLAPEERWWLYTTINATSAHPDYGPDRGWRKAIKIALGENPTVAPAPYTVSDAESIPAALRFGLAPRPRSGRKSRASRPTATAQAALPLLTEDEP